MVPLFLASVITVTRIQRRCSFLVSTIVDVGVSVLVWSLLPQPSIVPWWGPLTRLISRWPKLCSSSIVGGGTTTSTTSTTSSSSIIKTIAHGGPLGPGCGKAVEVIVAIALWKLIHGEWPSGIISLGVFPPPVEAWVGLAVLSITVNAVLHLWSRSTKSRGDHKGVHEVMDAMTPTTLSAKENVRIACLALLNGACEEITSRYFWMSEFRRVCLLTATTSEEELLVVRGLQTSNVAQALMFGIWHYHGIPSGYTGVALTFVYGIFMGLLYQYGGESLFLPILAHGIADYYILAIIVRQKNTSKSS